MADPSATLLRHITHRAAVSAPDAVLLGRFVADRDADAFAGLVQRHGAVVYRVCRRLVGPSAADDAFQATFLILATRAAAVRKAGSVGSWLVGVAGRVARQMRAAERRRAAHERAAPVPAGGRELDDPEAAEQARILHDELTRLSDRLRGPVVACLLWGRTYEQAAAELGGSARTVRRRLDEAKRVLRARLERRGVAPAAAAGLVAAAGAAEATAPAGLGSRTAAAVSDFLAGGATTPAAAIAKGVAAAMTTSVRMAAVLVATAAAGLAALGVGLAGDGQPVMPQGPPPAAREQPRLAGPAPTVSTAAGPGSVPGAPSAAVMRAIEHEAKFQYDDIARLWFGKDGPGGSALTLDVCGAADSQPFPPPPDHSIRVMYWTGRRGPLSQTRFTFDGGKLTRAWIDLSGDLESTLVHRLPYEMTRVVLTERFGVQPPWWAEEGIALTAPPPRQQADFDALCRIALRDGRALRLSALFALPGGQPDSDLPRFQAHSVVRFLLATQVPGRGPLTVNDPDPLRTALLEFLRQGARDGWAKAASAVYGFADVAALEEAWLRWMKSPESQFAEVPATVVTPPPVAHPPTIPPVKLP